jgi:HD-GYP domain-containing protein (c-di-GMP phosphodiesterase class II)
MAKKLGERLIEAGLCTQEAVQQALAHQKITGHKLGDCLVEIGLLQEAALLRFLAAEFQTRFVSAEKLAKAKIPTEVLDKVPVRVVESQNILPLAYDPERKLLSIVAAEPQNKSMLDEIALIAGLNEVYAYVGLRSAIAAAIKKHYYGDPTAFAALEAGGPQALRADVSAMAGAYESASQTGGRSAPSLQLRLETDPRMRLSKMGGSSTQVGRMPTKMGDSLTMMGPRGGLGENDYVETLNILVTMLEQSRPHHRGHSGQLARQTAIVGRRLGMPPKELAALAIASYLHDLGKPPERHFTLASNAVNLEWKVDAKRHYRAPTKMFEAVHLPVQVNTILAQMYEAYDGSGTPQGVKGEEITLGARILAAVDSFLDLTKNPANAHGKVFSKQQALEHLRQHAGVLYDPVVADIVGQVQSGELLRSRIAADGRQVLIAEPDEAMRTDLLESVLRQELVAHAISTLDGALDGLTNRDCDVLVVSLRFGIQEVLSLLQYTRTTPELAGLPVIVVGDPDAPTKERLLQGGATVVMSGEDPDAAAKSIREHYEDRIQHNGPARVVRGSFDELPPVELLKLLGAGRKSGRLQLRQHAHEGFLYLEHGKVVAASLGTQLGEPALQGLLQLRQADFQYDPDALLLDVPQLSKDLEQLAKEAATPRRPTSAPAA